MASGIAKVRNSKDKGLEEEIDMLIDDTMLSGILSLQPGYFMRSFF